MIITKKALTSRLLVNPSLTRINLSPFTTKDEKFLRFLNFGPEYLSRIPYFFQPLEPLILNIRDHILLANSHLALPWWAVLCLSALVVRLTIFPLILVQIKRFSKMGPVSPALVYLKEGWSYSQLGIWGRCLSSMNIYRDICRQEGFKLSTIFVYNLAYYPLLISMIFGIRQLLVSPELEGAGFLYISNFSDIDPYFLLPSLTIALYYFNFQRFITPENKKTILSKIRRACQVLLIIWYPFLCSWPSGLVLYMCANALVSVLQTSLMKSQWWVSRMNQKALLYTSIMQSAEYDKGTSEGIIQGIRRGQQNFASLAIQEVHLEQQTIEMLVRLQKEDSKGRTSD